MAISLDILYEDNHLLAVVKPAGLLVQGDRSGDTTLLAWCREYIREKYRKPGHVYLGLVHRLDRPVSGVIVVARTSKAAGRLSRKFRDGKVRKRYLALVEGAPPKPAGDLAHILSARADRAGRTLVVGPEHPAGRPSRLRYRVLWRGAGGCLLEVESLTGRRHQIRVQLAAAGCPITGDVKYGAARRLPTRSIGLHAWCLELDHPVGDRGRLSLTAPLPVSPPWDGLPAGLLAERGRWNDR